MLVALQQAINVYPIASNNSSTTAAWIIGGLFMATIVTLGMSGVIDDEPWHSRMFNLSWFLCFSTIFTVIFLCISYVPGERIDIGAAQQAYNTVQIDAKVKDTYQHFSLRNDADSSTALVLIREPRASGNYGLFVDNDNGVTPLAMYLDPNTDIDTTSVVSGKVVSALRPIDAPNSFQRLAGTVSHYVAVEFDDQSQVNLPLFASGEKTKLLIPSQWPAKSLTVEYHRNADTDNMDAFAWQGDRLVPLVDALNTVLNTQN